MAQKVVLTLTDDLDGSEAAETVAFSIDGSSFEMELSVANAADLRRTLEPYRAAGRRLSGTRAVKQVRTTASSKDVRRLAAEMGIDVNPRGRVRGDVVELFAAAHS